MAELKLVFNPAYLENRGHYVRHRDWIESDPQVLASEAYLYRTELEKTDVVGEIGYHERLRFLDTDNEIEPLLTIHYADLTKDKFGISGFEVANSDVIRKDMDSEGHSDWELTKELFWRLLGLGFAAVETSSTPNPSDNSRDAVQFGERSYSRLIEPESIVEWERFTQEGPKKGQLSTVTIERGTVKDGDDEYQEYRRYWLESQYVGSYSSQLFRSAKSVKEMKSDKEIDLVPTGPQEVGALPVIPVTFFGDPIYGIKNTVIYRAVWLMIIVLNKQSFYDKTGRYQGSEKHIIATDSLNEIDAVATATNTLGVIPDKDAKLLTLPSSDPVANWRDIQRGRQSVRHQVLLQSNQAVNPESKESPSVESKQADAEARKNFLNELTDVIQAGMESVYAIHVRFEDRTIGEVDVTVEFKRDFALKDFEMEQQQEATLLSLASQLGKAGVKIKKQVAINRVMTMRIVEYDGIKEENIRQELIDAIVEEEETPVQSGLGASLFQRRLQKGVQPGKKAPVDDDEEEEPESEAA